MFPFFVKGCGKSHWLIWCCQPWFLALHLLSAERHIWGSRILAIVVLCRLCVSKPSHQHESEQVWECSEGLWVSPQSGHRSSHASCHQQVLWKSLWQNHWARNTLPLGFSSQVTAQILFTFNLNYALQQVHFYTEIIKGLRDRCLCSTGVLGRQLSL